MPRPPADPEAPTAVSLEGGPPSGPPPPLPPGTLLAGRYRIARFIAQGGMGAVYEAEDADLRQHVALKVLRRDVAPDEQALERFRREILLSRKVTHPNVCRVFDLGRHEGLVFLTMELLAGQTLAERLRRGRMPIGEALPLVRQIVDALAAAHAAGVVHRDFKPANVVLVPRPGEQLRAVVTDFGLALASTHDPGEGPSLTEAGITVGTAAYMAPEQVEGEPITPATDVYALGVVLYEMVTGTRPFEGTSPLSTAVKRLTAPPPPPRARVADLDPRWEAVILRCLGRRPGQRFASVLDVARALSGEPVARPGHRPWTWAVATLVIASLAAGVYRLAGPRRPPAASLPAPAAAPARPSIAVLGFRNLTRRPDVSWLSTALAEMLTTELAAGEQLRTVPGETVARARIELGLGDVDSLAKDTLSRVRGNIGADVVVLGSFTAIGPQIRLDLRAQSTTAGETVASLAESGSEDQLFDLVSRCGARLRAKLGVAALSQADASAVRSLVPASSEAARLYAEGLARLRVFDAPAARELLEKAVAADPKHAPSYSALADAWSVLGYDTRARAAAQRAFELSRNLPREERLAIEARFRMATHEWDAAVRTYRTLCGLFPDDLEYGLRLAAALREAGRGREALEVVDSLHALPAPAGADGRIDLEEAGAANVLSDFQRLRRAAARAADKARAAGARLLLARALRFEGWALDRIGQPQAALARYQEARAIYEAAGDHDGAAWALAAIADIAADNKDFEQSRLTLEEALRIHRSTGNRGRVAATLNNLAVRLWERGDLLGAARRFEEALAVYRELGDKEGTLTAQSNLGLVQLDRGELGDAQRSLEASLASARELGNQSGLAVASYGLGGLAAARGDLAAAERSYAQALEIARAMDQRFVGYALCALGRIELARGDTASARQRLEESLAIRQRLGGKVTAAESRVALAEVLVEDGQAGRAEALAREAAEALRAEGVAAKEATALRVLGRSLLAQGRLEEALTPLERAESLSAQDQNPQLRIAVALEGTRARALGRTTGAPARLQALLAEATRAGLVSLQYEARLALGEGEIAAGKPSGRARLAALEPDARARGFGRIAREAAAAAADRRR